VISALMREDERALNWLSSLSVDDRVLTCPIARGEILYGIARLAPGRRRWELESKAATIFFSLPCEPLTARSGDFYSQVKVDQQKIGLSLDENDLWIAACAWAIGATLVSRDSDFGRVATLPVLVI
jgi:predicted nucleic acid-binding protein